MRRCGPLSTVPLPPLRNYTTYEEEMNDLLRAMSSPTIAARHFAAAFAGIVRVTVRNEKRSARRATTYSRSTIHCRSLKLGSIFAECRFLG
ncbi:hypothetical protein Trydic_g19368 [Trypoxylus dichotomus]